MQFVEVNSDTFVLQCWLWFGDSSKRLCIIFAWNCSHQLDNVLFLLRRHEGLYTLDYSHCLYITLHSSIYVLVYCAITD